MTDEPPVNGDTPETPNTPETPTPEKKSHTGLIVTIVLIVIVVLLALFFGLYFGLRNNEPDTPEEVNPDPEIVEPGPEEEPEHTHEYGNWQYDDTYHWKECECGEIIDKEEHTLDDPTLGDDGYYQICSICGYTTTPVEAVPTSWKVETSGDLIIETTNSESGDSAGTLNLDEYVSITIYDQYGGELSEEGLDSYTLTVASGDISVTDHIVTSTTYETGAASITLASSVIENATADLTITLTQKTYNVTTITIDGSNAATHTVEWGGSYIPEIVVSPTWANNQSYEITGEGTLFTYDESTGTFTHNQTHSGNETFTVKALDGSGVTATLTLTAEPEILEPQSASFDGLEGTYEKGTVINNLDSYLRVNFDENDHQEGDFVDDTCIVEYTSSNTNVVTIDNSAKTATCVGTGTATITATITPDHDTANPITTDVGATINVIWTASTLTMSSTTLDLTVGDRGTLSVTIGPDGQTTNPTVNWKITSGSDYVSISPETGDSITVTAVSAGTAVITASADGCSSVTCTVTITQAYNFATDSWETINEICTNGEASTYYNIGDTKTITINGGSYDIRIDDFDHDDLTESNSSYNSNSGKAAITVEMVDSLSSNHVMNSTNTNSGGWYSCDMRSYLSDTVFSTLDEDLQAVIKKVDKVGLSSGNQSTEFTTSSDSLFLLAEVEVDGTTSNGYKDEGTQYAYWSEHNTDSGRVKYRNGSAEYWWLRSPYTSNSTSFRWVTYTGSNGNANAVSSNGVSFAFCI